MKEIYQHPRFDMLHNALLIAFIFVPGCAVDLAKQIKKYSIKQRFPKILKRE